MIRFSRSAAKWWISTGASCLMDKELLQASLDAMRDEQQNSPRWDAMYGAQWVWDYYCERHSERHNESFRPNVDPTWDA
jgi:hypothetical protein